MLSKNTRCYVDAFLLMFCIVLVMATDMTEEEVPKKPHLEMHPRMIAGIFLAGIGLFLSASSGIGGGGILVPVYILVMGIPPTYAIALSNITILGGSIANTAIFMRKPHPNRDKSLIDFEFAVLMEPPTMAGAMIGTIVNKNSPVWLVTILLVTVLLLLTLRTYYKAFKRYKQEELQLKEKAAASSSPPGLEKVADPEVGKEPQVAAGAAAEGDETQETNPLSADVEDAAGRPVAEDGAEEPAAPDEAAEGGAAGGEGTVETTLIETSEDQPLMAGKQQAEASPELLAIYEEEKKVPWKLVLILPSIFAVILTLVLLLKLSNIMCGSLEYWILTVAPMLLCYMTFFVVSHMVVARFHRKQQLGYDFREGDIQWTLETTVLATCVVWVAGVCAGLFGIGGGVFKAPQMLEMGMLPEVVSATTAFMIFFTSASATISYTALDLVAWDIAPILFGVGIVCTLLGQLSFEWFMVQYMEDSVHAGSYIIFLIGTVLGVSTVLLGYAGVVHMVHTFHHGDPNFVLGTCG